MNIIKKSIVVIAAGIMLTTHMSADGGAFNNMARNILGVSVSPDIPLSVKFAGENIDFDRIDMYERLDRELTQIAYGHSSLLLTLKRANRYFPSIVPILKNNGVSEDFAYLAAIESNLNVRAYSKANAAGMWQFLAPTARQFGLEVNDEVDERYDPEKATEAACKYLKSGYAKYKHWATVAASYNAGMGRISGELSRQLASSTFDLYLNEETSRYVFRILAMKLIIESPQKYGYYVTKEQLYQPLGYSEVEVSGAVPNWSSWSVEHGITYAQLRELNPWIRSIKLTNKSGKKYVVRIPLMNELYRSKRSYSAYNKNWTID